MRTRNPSFGSIAPAARVLKAIQGCFSSFMYWMVASGSEHQRLSFFPRPLATSSVPRRPVIRPVERLHPEIRLDPVIDTRLDRIQIMRADTRREAVLTDHFYRFRDCPGLAFAGERVGHPAMDITPAGAVVDRYADPVEDIFPAAIGDKPDFPDAVTPVFIDHAAENRVGEEHVDAALFREEEGLEYLVLVMICLHERRNIHEIAGVRPTADEIPAQYHPAKFEILDAGVRNWPFQVIEAREIEGFDGRARDPRPLSAPSGFFPHSSPTPFYGEPRW